MGDARRTKAVYVFEDHGVGGIRPCYSECREIRPSWRGGALAPGARRTSIETSAKRLTVLIWQLHAKLRIEGTRRLTAPDSAGRLLALHGSASSRHNRSY